MNLPRVIIAGTNSGVGKTTLTLGIISALRKKGISVQPFKTGPDYIDPTYHTEASGKACVNLDSWLLSKDTVVELFRRRAKNADISIIEGVMGLYDGLKNSEQGSTSHLAKILNSPVILILNAHSLSRSAGAIALGYKEFDREIDIAGIILNNIGSENHYHYVKTSIERKTKIPVLGYLPMTPTLKLPQRHLGLIPLEEKKLQHGFCKKLSRLVEKNINLSALLKISRQAGPLTFNKERIFKKKHPNNYVTIAVAKDAAFNFYYQDNLDILKHLGAKIVTFSPLRDRKLPESTDGLYIGGGFPELFACGLSKNKRIKGLIYQKAEEGLPIYAECGGLMYLVESIIDFKKRSFPMVGIFKGLVKMADRRQALGYVNVETTRDNILSKQGARIRGHVFHWSYLEARPKEYPYAYKITKDKGKVFYDGLIKNKVLASYVHLHFASCLDLPKNFIHNCKEYRINHA
ncbi:MAG: cobyrinate a,c-diamide synthase [Candidatus Omnitrophota bacterium]|nr:cobyrinate a,c-diamide synthase [Candidatus Omnitrophota bacterium]